MTTGPVQPDSRRTEKAEKGTVIGYANSYVDQVAYLRTDFNRSTQATPTPKWRGTRGVSVPRTKSAK